MRNPLKQIVRERPDALGSEINTYSKQLHSFRYSIVSKYAQGKLLDVGCGIGNLYKALGERIDYFGIDISKEAIDEAKTSYASDSKFKTYDGINIPFPDNFFEVVSSLEVIEHLPKREQCVHIKEIKRLAKPGGTIVISTPNRNYLIKLIRKRCFKWNNPFHKYEFKTSEFVNFLKQHSLRIVDKIYIGDPLNLFGNFLIQRLFRSKPRFQKCLFQSSLIINKLFKNFCNDVLIVCKN